MSNPIIVNGKLYYTEPLNMPSSDSLGGGTYGPTVCVDLRSGQLLWSRTDVPALSFAYLYDIQDPQQHGTYPAILFTANFARAFDADTGAPLFNVTGVPSGTLIMGPQGEQLRIGMANAGTTANPDWRIVQWNSSKLWTGLGFATGTAGWVPTATGAIDASTSARYDWNVSIPWLNTMPSTPSVLVALYGDTMICMNGSRPALGSSNPYTYFAVSLKPQTLGNMTWIQTYNAPAGNVTVNQGPNDPVNRVFVEAYKETRQFVGYSMDSGAKLWGPTASQADLDYYGNGGTANIGAQAAYGKLYSIGYSGILYCYDSKTGDKLWTYGNGGAGNSTNAGFETGQGTYPAVIAAVGNGVIYLMSAEHTIQTPIYKGAMVRALNATDGTEIWTLSTYVNQFIVESFAIADGFATFPNSYDNMVYSIGRGPSATTVDAPMAAITQGSSLVIRGTVTDISAGTKQNQQAADHPNGVPVASDAIMTNWMGYIYQQKQLPTSFTGVEVTLSVIDSNGNQRTIGTTTTDSSGAYSYQWKPDITGKYEVTATFAGTNSYWPSSAVTSFAVDPAAPTPAPTQAPQQSTADTYLLSGIAAIIVVIVIIGAMIMLMLRKHP
jgi:outer membrane protein assembly factor BamB